MELAERGVSLLASARWLRRNASAEAWSWAAWALLAAVAGLLFAAVFFGGGSGDDSLPTLGSLAVLAAAAAVGAAAFGVLALPAARPGRQRRAAGGRRARDLDRRSRSCGRSPATARGRRSRQGLVYLAFLRPGPRACGIAPRACGARLGRDAGARPCCGARLGAARARRCPALVPGRRPHRAAARAGRLLERARTARRRCGAARASGSRTLVSRRRDQAAGGLLVYGAVLALMLTQSRAGLIAARRRCRDVARCSPRAVSKAGCWGSARRRARARRGGLGVHATRARRGRRAPRRPRADDGALFGILAVAGAAVAVGTRALAPCRAACSPRNRRAASPARSSVRRVARGRRVG